jgi:hypothetical protein
MRGKMGERGKSMNRIKELSTIFSVPSFSNKVKIYCAFSSLLLHYL